MKRNEQGRLGTFGKRPSRESSFPGVERGTGDPLTAQNAGIERPLEDCRRRRCRQAVRDWGLWGVP